MDDATHDILVALAYESELAVATLAARTGIPHDVIALALASDDIFDVCTVGDEPVSVKLTDRGYRLARNACAEWAA
jgi:hypothetical protein